MRRLGTTSIIVCLLVLIELTSFNLIADFLPAVSAAPLEIYTNSAEYSYKFRSDAARYSYELAKDGQTVESQTKELERNQAEKNIEIDLNFQGEGEYQLVTQLWDWAENYNRVERKLIFDKTAPNLQIESGRICGDWLCADITTNEQSQLLSKDKKIIDLVEGKQRVILARKWAPGEQYKFDLTAKDRAGNKSEILKIAIRTPSANGGAGEVNGTSAENPWGKNNKTGTQTQYGTGVIYSEAAGKRGLIANLPSLASPQLTYAKPVSAGWEVYGTSVNLATPIKLSIKHKHATISEATNFCANESNRLRIGINHYNGCLTQQAGYRDLLELWSTQLNHCANYFWPWEKAWCINEFNDTNRLAFYLGNKEIKTTSVSVELISPAGQNIAGEKLARSNKFSQAISDEQASANTKLRAVTKVRGFLKIAGRSFKLRELTSLKSNALALPESGVKLRDQQCSNSSCKTLNVNYVNQFVDERGKYEYWPGWQRLAGGQSCGAASSVMVADYFGKLIGNHRLKSYIYQDNGYKLEHKRCSKPGAFAVTAYNSNCNMSSIGGIKNYLGQLGLKTKVHWGNSGVSTADIISALKRGNPVILSYKRPIGHILVVKGFTYGNQLVVNDPYRDFQNDYRKGVYDYSGRDAIYQLLPNSNYQINYAVEVLN